MGIKIKMPKVKMPSTKDIGNAFNDAGKAIEKTANDAGKAIENTANDAGKAIEKTANDAYKDVSKAATDAYNYADSLAKDTAAVTKSVANTVAKTTEEAAKQGINVASDEWKQGSKFAVDAYNEGAEAVQKAAEDAYAWLDANACRIGLTTGLTIGIVAYFTPKPAPADPGTVNSTAASMTWAAWFASQAGKQVTKAETMVLSCSIAYIINEGLFLIPGVKGQVNKNLMFNCLANSINTTISNPVLWGTPAGVGVAVSSGIAPIVATLICEGVLPKGASAGPDAKAAEQGIKMAKDALKKLGL
jgi:hypothetical protein